LQIVLALLALAAASNPGEAKDCTCRAGGHDYQLGDVICIRGRLSQCQMNQNNTSWKEIGNECPRAALPVKLASSPLPQPLRR
jgi:hypothetical protein